MPPNNIHSVDTTDTETVVFTLNKGQWEVKMGDNAPITADEYWAKYGEDNK
jgi:hypothetical protein